MSHDPAERERRSRRKRICVWRRWQDNLLGSVNLKRRRKGLDGSVRFYASAEDGRGSSDDAAKAGNRIARFSGDESRCTCERELVGPCVAFPGAGVRRPFLRPNGKGSLAVPCPIHGQSFDSSKINASTWHGMRENRCKM